jgi:hypothetical protein
VARAARRSARLSAAARCCDVVLSTFGCLFVPDHERAASEIVRVLDSDFDAIRDAPAFKELIER